MKKTDVVNKNMIEQGLYVYFFFFFFLNWILNCKLTLFLISHNALCLPPLPPNFMYKSCFQMLFIWEYAILPGAFEN